MPLILNIAQQDLQPVNLGRQFGSDCRLTRVVALCDFSSGAGRVSGDDTLPAMLLQKITALRERVDVAVDTLDCLKRRSLGSHQLVLHA